MQIQTAQLNYAAFIIARGGSLEEWDKSTRDDSVTFTVATDDEASHLAYFQMEVDNVNVKSFLNARNMLLDIIRPR